VNLLPLFYKEKSLMAIDTPARIAVLGAGPMGLETALYARFLGYDVDLFERGQIADHVRQWGHIRLFTPFGMNSSPLGRSAISTQSPEFNFPAEDALLTGQQWIEAYWQPLSQVDLLRGQLHEQTEVISVGKESYLKSELVSSEDRFDELFLILTRDANGAESWHEADIVIDTTGTFGTPNHLGPGGMFAAGESILQRQTTWAHEDPWLSYRLPDIHRDHRSNFCGKQTLVIGTGYSAATNLAALLTLQQKDASTQITWATRHPIERLQTGLIARFKNDPLPQRDDLAQKVNEAARAGSIHVLPEAQIQRLSVTEHKTWQVKFCNEALPVLEVDTILANVGYRGDWDLSEELQVHRCYASGGPMKWSATLVGSTDADCLTPQSQTAESLMTTEPNFYVLGSKSHNRWSNFLFQNGLDQIRMLFSVIAERDSLNLYNTPLPT
jgi:thioredoxin reductase